MLSWAFSSPDCAQSSPGSLPPSAQSSISASRLQTCRTQVIGKPLPSPDSFLSRILPRKKRKKGRVRNVARGFRCLGKGSNLMVRLCSMAQTLTISVAFTANTGALNRPPPSHCYGAKAPETTRMPAPMTGLREAHPGCRPPRRPPHLRPRSLRRIRTP